MQLLLPGMPSPFTSSPRSSSLLWKPSRTSRQRTSFPLCALTAPLYGDFPFILQLPSLCYQGWLQGEFSALTATRSGWSTARRLLQGQVGGDHLDYGGAMEMETRTQGDILDLLME